MTFNLKLFKFSSQEPLLVFSNSKCVYKVESLKNSEPFSLKMIHILNSSDYENCINEVNIQAMSSHPNIISCKGYTTSENIDEFGLKTKKFFILLEFHNHNLANEIKVRKQLNMKFNILEILKIFNDLIKALSYLQRKNICFMNIHPENVFLFDHSIKLGNFQNSFNTIGESSTKFNFFKGNTVYAEPIIKNALLQGDSQIEYNYFKNDVYSLGAMILELFFINSNETPRSPSIKKINEVKENYGNEGETLAKILELMLRENSKDRPDFNEIFEICEHSDVIKNSTFIEIIISSIKTSEITNDHVSPEKNHFNIKEPQKIEKSVFLEEKNDENSSDSLNERDSEPDEEIKEICHNFKSPQVQNKHYIKEVKESCFSSNFFGLDRESNVLISELPQNVKYSPEKMSLLLNLKKILCTLNLKLVDLETLKIQKKKPGKMEIDGDVFFCSNKSHLNLVVKIIKELNEENLLIILRRYDYINSKLSKNILKLEEYAIEILKSTNAFNLFLVFKEKKWDLKYAMRNKNFTILEKIFIAKQIATVLQEFHLEGKEKIVHGSLKPTNILLDNKNCVFLTDFVNSEAFNEGENLKKSRRININYSSPEQFLYKRLELNSDIWSLGIIFCELFFNIIITAENILAMGLYDEKKKQCLEVNEDSIGEVLWKKRIANLLQKMTFFESFQRISLPEILTEINSIENMLKFPSTLNNQHNITEFNEEGSKYLHSQKNSAGCYLTKQSSHNCFFKGKSNISETKKYSSTPKICSRKIKYTNKNFK